MTNNLFWFTETAQFHFLLLAKCHKCHSLSCPDNGARTDLIVLKVDSVSVYRNKRENVLKTMCPTTRTNLNLSGVADGPHQIEVWHRQTDLEWKTSSYIMYQFFSRYRYLSGYPSIAVDLQTLFYCYIINSSLVTDIDPSIATVRHLLELLNTAQENDILLQNQVKDLSDKVSLIRVPLTEHI